MNKNKLNFDHLIFLHLYKTGGTTLSNIITRQYKDDEIFSIGSNMPLEQFKELSNDKKNNLKMLQGHMKFGLHNDFNGITKYISLLRDPVERIVSLYYFVKYNDNLDLHKIMNPKEYENILDFIENINKYSPIHGNNGQTRLLSGRNYHISLEGESTWNEYIPSEEVNEDDLLKIAIDNIKNHFLFIGLLERFEESIILMKKYAGWSHLFFIQRNKSIKRGFENEINNEVIELIKKKNALDVKLYLYVKYILEEKIKENKNYIRKQKLLLFVNNSLYGFYRKNLRKYFKKTNN